MHVPSTISPSIATVTGKQTPSGVSAAARKISFLTLWTHRSNAARVQKEPSGHSPCPPPATLVPKDAPPLNFS